MSDPTPADRRALATALTRILGDWQTIPSGNRGMTFGEYAVSMLDVHWPSVLADLDLIDAYRELETFVGAFLTAKVGSDDALVALAGIAATRARVAELEAQR